MESLFKNIKKETNDYIYECCLLNMNTFMNSSTLCHDYIFKISKENLLNASDKTECVFSCVGNEFSIITPDNIESLFNIIQADLSGEVFYLVNANITNNSLICSKIKFLPLSYLLHNKNDFSDYKKLDNSNGIILSINKSDKNEVCMIQALLHTDYTTWMKYTMGYNKIKDTCEKQALEFASSELMRTLKNKYNNAELSDEIYNYINSISLLS